jgi:hypothetical protein
VFGSTTGDIAEIIPYLGKNKILDDDYHQSVQGFIDFLVEEKILDKSMNADDLIYNI